MIVELSSMEFGFLKHLVGQVTVNASQPDGRQICDLVQSVNNSFAQAEAKNSETGKEILGQPAPPEAENEISERKAKRRQTTGKIIQEI